MQLEDEILLGVGHDPAQRLYARGNALFIEAETAYRHSAIGEIGHRKARRERQHGVVLVLQALQLPIETFAGLDERALRRDAREVVQLVEGARHAPPGLEHLVE